MAEPGSSPPPEHPFPSATTPLARTGRHYTRCAVGFIDTLGAKAFAADEKFLNALAYMVDLQRKMAMVQPGDAVRAVFFSDNIGASIPLAGLDAAGAKRAVCQLLRLLAGIQLYYLRDFGILCRGGVAVGDCFRGENMIFGPALVEAYRLECTAVTPRIAVSDEIVALAGGDVVALLPAEPLIEHGTTVGAAPAIDFLRAECPDAPARARHFSQLRAAIADGAARSSGAAQSKWEWTARRLDELEAAGNRPDFQTANKISSTIAPSSASSDQ